MNWYTAIWIVSFIIIASCGLIFMGIISTPSSNVESEMIGSTGYQQEKLHEKQQFFREVDGYEFTITAKYKYNLIGVVVGKDYYYQGTMEKLSPIDLTVAWGKTIDPEYSKYITFSKYKRHYRFKFYEEQGVETLSKQYIVEHSSNNHLIFADESSHDVAKGVRLGDIVNIEGYLVDAYGRRDDGAYYSWYTSTKRSDAGEGSCEVLYVENITLL